MYMALYQYSEWEKVTGKIAGEKDTTYIGIVDIDKRSPD